MHNTFTYASYMIIYDRMPSGNPTLENGPYTVGVFLIDTSMNRGFSTAMFDYQGVTFIYCWVVFLAKSRVSRWLKPPPEWLMQCLLQIFRIHRDSMRSLQSGATLRFHIGFYPQKCYSCIV